MADDVVVVLPVVVITAVVGLVAVIKAVVVLAVSVVVVLVLLLYGRSVAKKEVVHIVCVVVVEVVIGVSWVVVVGVNGIVVRDGSRRSRAKYTPRPTAISARLTLKTITTRAHLGQLEDLRRLNQLGSESKLYFLILSYPFFTINKVSSKTSH